MAKLSVYKDEWDIDPISELMSKYAYGYCDPESLFDDIGWDSVDDQIHFMIDIEDRHNVLISDDLTKLAFENEITIKDFLVNAFELTKKARLSTQSEKMRSKQYRMNNKAEIARKAKIRRSQQKSGIRRKKRRIGSAGAGYSFIDSPTPTPTSSSAKVVTVSSHPNSFNPNVNRNTVIRNQGFSGKY